MGRKRTYEGDGQRNHYRDQPRDPFGRWIKTDLVPGEYTATTKSGRSVKYWVQDRDRLSAGSSVLNMAAHAKAGNQYTKLDEATADERIHILATDDGEEMAVAASHTTTFGFITHGKEASEDCFSVSRGSEFMPTSAHLADDETAYGGRKAKLNGRKDGKQYDTLNTRRAEECNRSAFEDADAQVWPATPETFRLGAVQVRHWYQSQGVSESKARDMPMHVSVDAKGNLRFEPAMKPGKDGKFTYRHSPKAKDGSTVKLRVGEVTRMAGAMERDGVKNLNFSITRGTNVSRKGRPIGNALHFRADYTQPRSNASVTMWGTIESKSEGAMPEPARNQLLGADGRPDPDKVARFERNRTEFRRRRAVPFHNPKDRETASTLMLRRWHRDVPEDHIRLGSDGSFLVKEDGNDDYLQRYLPNGERSVKVAVSVDGFKTTLMEQSRASRQPFPVDVRTVRKRDDGLFEAKLNKSGETGVFNAWGRRVG